MMKAVLLAGLTLLLLSHYSQAKQKFWGFTTETRGTDEQILALPCTAMTGHVFDYRDTDAKAMSWKGKVERAHFTPSVQRGIRGNAASLMGDLAYVLGHFPNHPRALAVLGNHQASDDFNPRRRADRKDYYWPKAAKFFHDAICFAPDDPAVYHVIAFHYHRTGEPALAERYYKKALALAPDNPELNYNAGLFYADQHAYDKARQLAAVAYKQGYPLPGLKQRLKQHGAW